MGENNSVKISLSIVRNVEYDFDAGPAFCLVSKLHEFFIFFRTFMA